MLLLVAVLCNALHLVFILNIVILTLIVDSFITEKFAMLPYS